MIKKYLLDILCLILVVIVPFLIAERPMIDLYGRTGVSPVINSEKTAIKEETKKLEKEIVRDIVASKALRERNIFSPDGSYTLSRTGATASLPESPYTLIGILKGEENRAVFRDHTGSIITLTVGKKLSDGSVVTRIDTTSVEVKKGEEKRELKIFDIKPPKPLPLKKP